MKSVLVTGAGSGIGLATARRFTREGFAVAGVDLEFPAEALEILDPSLCFESDVTSFEAARRTLDRLLEQLGRLDALVTCAGISRDAPVWRLTETDWDAAIGVDLKGTFNYIAAAVPHFRRQESGRIVAVASTAAMRARRGISNYVAAKAGVIGLVRAFACDLRGSNISVNAVAPGLVLTRLAERVPPETRERLRGETCLGRVATADDVANVIYFLCTEASRGITGQVIRVDGGQLA